MQPDPSVTAELRRTFVQLANGDRRIDRGELEEALQLRSDLFSERLFALFDHDGSGAIDIDEFCLAIDRLVVATAEEKIAFAFRLHDIDGDGLIERGELATVIEASLAENRLVFEEHIVQDLVDLLMEDADTDRTGTISLEEFTRLLSRSPGLLEAMTVSPVAWLSPGNRSSRRHIASITELTRDEAALYMRNRWDNVVVLTLYAVANVVLGWMAAQHYAEQGASVAVQIARACGAALNFNGMLILLPVMRRLLTGLRNTVVHRVLSVDEAIEFHKIVGHVMFALALVHTGAHVVNYTTLDRPLAASLFTTSAGLTGVLLLAVFATMWWTARDGVRRTGRFTTFHLAHALYVAWFALALLHGPVFWMWVTVPLVGFAVDRLLRRRRRDTPAPVRRATLLPSRVTAIEVARPEEFAYAPGDYAFIRCPEISRFEWHPFTISSAPEQRDVVSFHIRSAGSWTGRLADLVRARHDQKDTRPIEVYLDGPYDTPSGRVFAARNAVVIACGIGVTPYASVLRSVLHRSESGDPTLALKHLHFHWLTRDQKEFEWFVELLSRIEAADRRGMFDIDLHLTGAQRPEDMKSATLFTAIDVMNARREVDLITGLRCHTHTGRPDWRIIFDDLAQRYAPSELDVFFCGPPALAGELRFRCRQNGFAFHQERF